MYLCNSVKKKTRKEKTKFEELTRAIRTIVVWYNMYIYGIYLLSLSFCVRAAYNRAVRCTRICIQTDRLSVYYYYGCCCCCVHILYDIIYIYSHRSIRQSLSSSPPPPDTKTNPLSSAREPTTHCIFGFLLF